MLQPYAMSDPNDLLVADTVRASTAEAFGQAGSVADAVVLSFGGKNGGRDRHVDVVLSRDGAEMVNREIANVLRR